MRGQEEVSPHSLGLCHFVSCPEEGRKGGGSFGGPAPQSLLAEEAKVGAAVIAPWAWRGSCGGGWGGRQEEGGWPALGGGDGFSTHGKGGKGRGWGLPWEARDESPRDRGLEGGEDMETGHAGGP